MQDRPMHSLASEVWNLYRATKSELYIVKPSLPILYFGDSEAYFRSKRRIITVGLNPSHHEFPSENYLVRFPYAKRLRGTAKSPASYAVYLETLNRYFKEKSNLRSKSASEKN
jgi:hypothetical protein